MANTDDERNAFLKAYRDAATARDNGAWVAQQRLAALADAYNRKVKERERDALQRDLQTS